MPRKNYIAFKVDDPEVAGKIYNYAMEQGVDVLLTTDQNLVTKWRETRQTGQPRPDRALHDSQPSIEHGSGDEAGPSLPKKTVPQEDKPLPSINQQMGAQLPPVKASAEVATVGVVADSGPQRQWDIQPKCGREDSINQLPSIADGEMGGVTVFHVDEPLAARDVIRRESDDQTRGPTGDDKPFFVPNALQEPRSSEITPEAVVAAKPFAAVVHVDDPLVVRDVIMIEPDDQRQGPTGDDKPFTVSKVILEQHQPPAEAVEAVDDVNMEDSVEESQGPSGNKTPAVNQKRRGRPPGTTPSKKNMTAGDARRSLSAPDEAGEQGPSGGETPAVEAKKRGRKRKPPVEKLPENLMPYDIIINTEPHRRSLRHLAVTLDRGEPVEKPQQKRKTPVKAMAPPKKRATARRQEEEESQNEDEPEEEENVGWREWGEKRDDRPLFQGAHGSMDHEPSVDVKPSVQALQDPVLLRCFNEMVLNTPNKPGSVRVKEEPVDASVPIFRVKEEPMDEEQSIAHDVLDNIVSLIINDAACETIRVKKELIEDYGEQATAENMTCSTSIEIPDNLRLKKETEEYPAKDTTQNPPEVITLAGGPAAIVLSPENRAAVASDLSGIPHAEGHAVKVEQELLPKTGNQPMEQALPVASAAQIVTDVTSKSVGDVTQPQRALPVIEGPAANMEDIVLPPLVTHDNIRKKATTFHKSPEKPSSSACDSPYAKNRVIVAAARKSSPYKPILPISPVSRRGHPQPQQRQAQPFSPLSAASTSKNVVDVISGNAVPSVSGPAANLEDIVLPPTPTPVTHRKLSSSKHNMGSPYALHRTIRAKHSSISHGYPHGGQRQAQPDSPLSEASTSKKTGGAISGNAVPSVVGRAANVDDIVLPPTPAPQPKVLRNRSVGWPCRHSCGIFNTKGDLMTHMESHSTTPVKAPSLPPTTPASTKKECVCTVCGRVCASRIGLISHGKTHRK